MINACQLKGSHSVVTIHSSRYRFSPPKFWEGGSEARSGGFICTCMSKLTIKKNYILSSSASSPIHLPPCLRHPPFQGGIFPFTGPWPEKFFLPPERKMSAQRIDLCSRARPGIHAPPRAEIQLQVRQGIQVHVVSVEPPPVLNHFQHKCRQQPVREAHYINWFAQRTISFPFPLPLSPFPCLFRHRLRTIPARSPAGQRPK